MSMTAMINHNRFAEFEITNVILDEQVKGNLSAKNEVLNQVEDIKILTAHGVKEGIFNKIKFKLFNGNLFLSL